MNHGAVGHAPDLDGVVVACRSERRAVRREGERLDRGRLPIEGRRRLMSRQRAQQHAVNDAPQLDRPVVTARCYHRAIRRVGNGGHRKVVTAAHPDDVGSLRPAGQRPERHRHQAEQGRDQRHTNSSHDLSSTFPVGWVSMRQERRQSIDRLQENQGGWSAHE